MSYENKNGFGVLCKAVFLHEQGYEVMTDLKFDKEETSVAVDLKALDESLSAAIDQTAQQSLATGSRFSNPSSDTDVLADAVTTKAAPGALGVAVGAALTAQEDVRGSKSSGFFMGEGSGGNKANRRHGSIFVGEAPNPQQKMTNALGLPLSYSEKKVAAKQANKEAHNISRGKGSSGGRDLMGDVNAAGAALTGKSFGHSSSYVCKGARMDPQAAARLGLVPQSLVDTLNAVRAAENSPGMSAARLQEGLGRGDANAEQFVQNNPVMAEQIFKNSDIKPAALEPHKK